MSDGNERNKPCPCGSGKKFKKCCLGRKTITTTLTATYDKPVQVSQFAIGPNGAVEFIADDGSRPNLLWRSTSYERDRKGPKELFGAPVETDRAALHLNSVGLIAQYNNVFAIDTNTIVIDGINASVSCIIEGGPAIDVNKGPVFAFVPIGLLEFHGCDQNQEQFAISLLQSMISNSKDYEVSHRYAIVNDCDAGNFTNYNRREVPIFDKTYLLGNVDLMYASADSGREIANTLIKRCDELARQARMNLQEEGLERSEAKAVRNGPCSKFCIHALPLAVKTLPHGWLHLSLNVPLMPAL